MADLRQFGERVRQKLAQLQQQFPGQTEIFLVSIENGDKGVKAGFFVSATPELAARSIVSATHRLASPEEIDGYHSRQQTTSARLKEREQKLAQARSTSQTTVVVQPAGLTPEQIAALASIGAGALPKPSTTSAGRAKQEPVPA